ncbi:CBU_0592 family membrane protein (plasmid) [Pseudoalteromonas sp. T1lg65]|uniref:CBU_0592 family membrane protein n=1 Tax=Pseudoalteromonas sp. T1lg65 TaxID=2077101 RepID=UPI003F79D641
MIDLLFDVIGMSGTFLVVGAFFMLQLDKATPDSLTYNLMNLSGAILLLISLCYNFNLASFVIELFWIAASLIGLAKYIKAKRLNTAQS